jgi:SAM-dependent methyltransferase
MDSTQASLAGTPPLIREFSDWCRDELFSPTMVEAAALLQRACDLHLAGLYRSIDLARRLQTPKTAAELTAELGYIESANIALEAILLRLASRTALLHVEFEQGLPRFTAVEDPIDTTEALDQVREAIRALGDGYEAAIDFLDFGAEHFVGALRDQPEFIDKVLTGRDARFAKLWYRATNEDPLQDVHGIMGARLVHDLFDCGRILEVGGGTGNGTHHLVRRFAENEDLNRIESYVFTDISLSFIISTRQKMKVYPSVRMQWRLLDMNKAFAEQNCNPGSADLIYGVNAAHCVRDIVGFLRQCHSTLSDGGKVVFAERVRMNNCEMAPRELTLNLSLYHRTAAIRNPEYRPAHGYLTAKGWLRAADLAGFSEATVYPDLEMLEASFPDQYAAVIVAEK